MFLLLDFLKSICVIKLVNITVKTRLLGLNFTGFRRVWYSMKPAHEGERPDSLSPDDAFGVLGNDIRVQILQTLGEAQEPLSFTELRDRIGIRQGGQFNYHLDKVVGHFVSKSEEGYALRRPGSHVVQAILSGAVTEDPVIEPTSIDRACYHCGGSVHLKYDENLATLCPECGGNYYFPEESFRGEFEHEVYNGGCGFLAGYEIPPAGVEGRSLTELLRAGVTWANLEHLSSSAGLCPRCSATVEESVRVCEPHEPTDGICSECGGRHQVRQVRRCSNCQYARIGVFARFCLGNPEFRDFLHDHGLDLIAPEDPMAIEAVLATPEEEVLSVEPFDARFTFTIEDDAITLRVGEDLEVTNVRRERVPKPTD